MRVAMIDVGSVIINDLNVVGIAVVPSKADPPLIVDPDAVLTGSVALELLEPISWRHSQIIEMLRGVDRDKFS